MIDPLGGSYYIETLTNQMEEEILKVMDKIDAAGGMYEAVGSGLVQSMIGQSALAAQEKIETGELTRRREETGAGAGLVIEQRDGQPADLTIGR